MGKQWRDIYKSYKRYQDNICLQLVIMKPNNGPVYMIKPKYIFKNPFMKYDLQNPNNREAQNQELTEYFNYGFNQDTMSIYAKLVNRTLRVLDHKKNLQYFQEPSELMRLNDQIPMDLGGFCKFYDPDIFQNDFIKNDQQLLRFFLLFTFNASFIDHKDYPMIDFVKAMYPKPATTNSEQQTQESDESPANSLVTMLEQITRNLEAKYEDTMQKLIEEKNTVRQPHYNPKKSTNWRNNEKGNRVQRPERTSSSKFTAKKGPSVEKSKSEKPKSEKRRRRRSRSSSSSSSSYSSSSSSQDSLEARKRRKHRKEKERKKRGAEKSSGKRRDKSRDKSKRKDESKRSGHKRSRSRDKKDKKRHR